MSEADLMLKLLTARWLWRMGSSTLLRVLLSTYETKPGTGGRMVELTDLDALGVEVAQDFRLRYRAAECKSGTVGARELFWLRGVADFYGGDEAYLVIDSERLRTPALRDLSEQLEIGVLTGADLHSLLPIYGDTESSPDSVLFNAATIERAENLISGLDRKLEQLVDYDRRLVWQVPPNRNLQLGVAYLEHGRDTLDPKNRGHLLIFAEHTYRYCLALFLACESVLKRGVSTIADHLPAYMHGGQAGLREARRRLDAVEKLQQKIEKRDRIELDGVFSPVPPYFGELLEIVTRLLRRPQHGTAILRHLQAAAYGALVAGVPVSEVLADQYDPIVVKLTNDIVAFQVKAAGLPAEFRTQMDNALNGSSLEGLKEGQPAAKATAARGHKAEVPEPEPEHEQLGIE